MIHAAKLLWILLLGLVFKDKEEYDFKSDKFNARKFIVSIILLLSIALNLWFVYRFYQVGNNYIALYTEVTKTCPDIHKTLAEKAENNNKKP